MKNREKAFQNVLTFLGGIILAYWLPNYSNASPAGIPHQCPIRYLRGSSALKGTAVVSFLIDKSGYVVDPAIVASSGSAQIDAASLQCVKPWHYLPVTKDGIPIAIRWIVDIAWNPQIPPDATRIVRDCAGAVGTRKEHADFQGETDFNLIYEEGKFGSVLVTHSSGNPQVDQEETNCFETMSDLKREIVVVVADESMAMHFDFSKHLTFAAQISLNKRNYSATIGPTESLPASN